MPNINRFKSVSVSIETYKILGELTKTLFPVEISKQKVIEYLIKKERKKNADRSQNKR